MKIGQSAAKSFAYLLGVYLGDGHIGVTKDKYAYVIFRLNTIDEDFALATKLSLLNQGVKNVAIRRHDVKRGNPNYALSSTIGELGTKLMDDTKMKQVIPNYVFNWSKDEKRFFLSGIMDSEGFVAKKAKTQWMPTNRDYYMGYKSCDVWVPELIRIMQSVGLRIGKVSQEKPRKEGYKTPTRFHIKMQSWVDAGCWFNISRKQNRVNEWASKPAYQMREEAKAMLRDYTPSALKSDDIVQPHCESLGILWSGKQTNTKVQLT